MNELTIVTAFFDVGKGDWKNTKYSRTNDVYMQQFEFWARMQNHLIVYTQSLFADRILGIRKAFGLEGKTQIVIVDDFREKNADLYHRMCKIEKNPEYALWGMNPRALSNRADYCYVMLMKYWCVNEASKLVGDNAMLAWMDFGFNHGGDLYTCAEEFAFTWKSEALFTDRRIHLFTLFPPDEVLLCESLQLKYVCVMGAMFIVPKELAGELWTLVKKAMEALVMLDAIDDDQQLLAMAYKYKPEIFSAHQSKWFLALKEWGGGHLSCKEKADPSAQKWREKLILWLCGLKNRKKKKKQEKLEKELACRIYKAAQKFFKYC